MELRNPFGLQNGQIIMIEDIDKAHNGLRCNCVCPACKEPFIARMGDVNQHHFAHSGKGCDEINAYMTGLYMLLSEYLTSNKLCLPPVIVGFELSAYAFWTQENVAEHSRLMSESREPDREILLYEQSKMDFDKAEIVRNNEGVPHAILAQKNDSQLAIRITPPDTVCKAGEAKKYKDVTTLEIDLSDAEEIISGGKKDEIFDYIKNNDSIFCWVYNPKIVKAYPEIIKRSKAYYDKAQQRIKQQEELQKQKEKERIKAQFTGIKSKYHEGDFYVGTKVRISEQGEGIITEINDIHSVSLGTYKEIRVRFHTGISRKYGLYMLIASGAIDIID